MIPRIALIHPYWDFWESSVPGDLRADRAALLADARAVLGGAADIEISHLLSPGDDLGDLGRRCAMVDAIIIVSTMAAPPAAVMAVLEIAHRPAVVIWALSRDTDLPTAFTHSDITTRGSTVGAPMIASALTRTGRPFDVVLTSLDEPEAAVAAVRRAGAAGLLKRSTVLRVGAPIPGYTSVDVPDDALQAMGIRVVRHEASELAARAREVTLPVVQDTVESLRKEFAVDPGVSAEALDRCARIEVALDQIVTETGANAGVINCHVPALRLDPVAGVAPCLALGRLTSRGIPWTCAGDVVTSVAMLAVRALGYPTLYHEVEAVDFSTDEVLLANTGEHDLGLCAGRARLIPNVWFTDDRVTGPCATFQLRAGPASLVAFTFTSAGPRWVVAEGAFTGREAPLTGTPHSGFRFASGHVAESWVRWAAAGVTHHSVATNALLGQDIKAVARHLNTDVVLA